MEKRRGQKAGLWGTPTLRVLEEEWGQQRRLETGLPGSSRGRGGGRLDVRLEDGRPPLAVDVGTQCKTLVVYFKVMAAGCTETLLSFAMCGALC